MKETNRMNVLLIELLVVILFFMLSATTLVRMFGTTKLKNDRSRAMTEATLQVENLAETLYNYEDTEAGLGEMGFVEDGGVWTLTGEDYDITVTLYTEATEAGEIRHADLKAARGDTVILEVPAVRYLPGEVNP